MNQTAVIRYNSSKQINNLKKQTVRVGTSLESLEQIMPGCISIPIILQTGHQVDPCKLEKQCDYE
ncbi:hypothetical protein IEZ28_02875 [Aerococcaceae bacterium zg-1292]|nr:hypothetical protein [Aerococcaceae bacterium zg-1292]